MRKLDEEMLVPLRWVVGAFGISSTIFVVGTFWVAAVNTRLARIEEKLGIHYQAITVVPNANANSK